MQEALNRASRRKFEKRAMALQRLKKMKLHATARSILLRAKILNEPPKMKMSIGTPVGVSQSGAMIGHWSAGAVKRALACAAKSLEAGVHSRPFQSMACAGGAPSMPSHHTSPSSVRAVFVKITFFLIVSIAIGLVP